MVSYKLLIKDNILRFLTSIFITIISLLVTVGLIEVGFRLLPSKQEVKWNDRPKFYYQHNLSPTLQDFPYSPSKEAGIFRVAVVGDSFSFAPYMQFDDAFPKKIERMLNLNSDKRQAEVINYSVPAYSTTHEVPKIKQAIEEQADLIILQITLNDPEIKAGTPIGITQFDRFGPPKYGKFVSWLLSWSKLANFIAQRLHNNETQKAYKEYFIDLYENTRSWNAFKAALGDISTLSKKSNTKLAAVIFPLFGLPLDESYPFYGIHKKVSDLLSELNIPQHDISEIYKGIPLERLQVLPGEDRHPNEIAHRMAAEEIYSWLVKEDFIPKELQILKRFKGRTRIIKEEPYS